MKKNLLSVVAAFTALGVGQLGATIFGDSIGDLGGGATATILDITSVEVTDTPTDLIFKINLNGDPTVTDWGKYMIGMTTAGGGDPAGNGWSRPIGMSSGMNYWVGSWADWGNGAEIRNWTGAWNLQSATYLPNPDNLIFSKDATSVTIQFSYAGLGLAPGSSFLFDVYTSGGGGSDTAIDALANPGVTVGGWSDYYNSGGLVDQYTITPVPEPAVLTLIGLGALALAQRSLRRR